MKHIIKYSLLALTLLVMANTNTFAQKFGHVNSVEILAGMSEWKAAEKELETYVKQLEQKLLNKEKGINDEVVAIRANIENMTPKQVQEKEKEIEQKLIQLDQEKVQAQKDILRKEQDLTEPLKKRVMDAIKSVASEQGYTYIFDIGVGILYADEGQDATTAVKGKLGM